MIAVDDHNKASEKTHRVAIGIVVKSGRLQISKYDIIHCARVDPAIAIGSGPAHVIPAVACCVASLGER